MSDAVLRSSGRDDLARKVRWVSEEDGDGAGYDIASFAPDGRARLIEVKTTNGWERTPFHITPQRTGRGRGAAVGMVSVPAVELRAANRRRSNCTRRSTRMSR